MAYEELVRRYQDVAVRTAYLISPDGDADALKEAFVKAYAALGRFPPEDPVPPVDPADRHEAAHAGDRPASRGLHSPSGPPRIVGRAMRLHRPSRRSSPRDADCVARGDQPLREGPRDHRRRYFLDLSEAETAEALRLPRAPWSRLSRALGRLREQLAATNGEVPRG